ncbi:hypothetical protein ACA910_020474 [Epithemia clementina (nom. ined.)]
MKKSRITGLLIPRRTGDTAFSSSGYGQQAQDNASSRDPSGGARLPSTGDNNNNRGPSGEQTGSKENVPPEFIYRVANRAGMPRFVHGFQNFTHLIQGE